jgi:hypothetical protein
MAGLEFSAPYNNDSSTLEKLFELKDLNGNHIREIYLSGPQQYPSFWISLNESTNKGCA